MRERPRKVPWALKGTSEYVKSVKISISESRPENTRFIGKVHAHEVRNSETGTIRSAGVDLLSLSAIRVRSDTFRAGSTSSGRTGGGVPLHLTLPFRSPPPRASACGPRNYFDETRACTY